MCCLPPRPARSLDTSALLTYLCLQLGEAGPSDVREYLRKSPFLPRCRHAAAVRVCTKPNAHTGNAIIQAMQGLHLSSSASVSGSQSSLSAGSVPPAPTKPTGEGKGNKQQPSAVPPGTALHFVCIEGGMFKLAGRYTSADGISYAVQVSLSLSLDPHVPLAGYDFKP